jgi:SAM-dependent methyltransferase
VGDDTSPEPTAARLAAQARIEVLEPLDRQLAPLGRRALEALAPVAGEHILDIGCGAGQTLLELAAAVQPGGRVLGVDISAPLVEIANRRARDLAIATCVEGDAQRYPFEPETFDAAFSRFGVMFFDDPTAAFINIRRALQRSGRLAFVCWRAFEENELDFLPLRAAAPHLPPWATQAPAPEAFSFAAPEAIHLVLSDAGFDRITIDAHDRGVSGGDLEASLAVGLGVGPLGKFLRENPDYRDAAAPAVRAALAEKSGPEGVVLNAATWIVTARRAG